MDWRTALTIVPDVSGKWILHLKTTKKTKQNKSKETNEKSTQPLLSDISKRM